MNKSLQQRLEHVIPGGSHTYSRGADQFPSNAPDLLVKGEGCYVWGPEGEKLLDYGMALRSVSLGYAHPIVNQAAINQINLGNNLTRASFVELEAAEKLVDMIPHVEMVKFAKNGSNVTSAAVKLARAYTAREKVAVPVEQPFFSFDDWFIGSTVMNRGTHEATRQGTLKFEYGNIESLRKLFVENEGQIAAVMLEAGTTLTPCSDQCSVELSAVRHSEVCTDAENNFLHKVQQICKENGAIFILDEMITGFRWDAKGAGHYFDLEPDLITFGKAMANGFSVAAVGGRREIMELGSINIPGLERTFLLSSTHGAEMSGLGAFLGATEVYENQRVIEHLWSYGSALKKGFEQRISAFGLENQISVLGPDISLALDFRDETGAVSTQLRTLFLQRMVDQGVLIPWIAISLAHDQAAMDKTFNAFEKTMEFMSSAVKTDLSNHVIGPSVMPVFRKYN
jgi:glutamate-1-semialdehyde 2,1-aminomutase